MVVIHKGPRFECADPACRRKPGLQLNFFTNERCSRSKIRIKSPDFFQSRPSDCPVRSLQHSRENESACWKKHWLSSFLDCDSQISGIVQEDPAANEAHFVRAEARVDLVDVIGRRVAVVVNESND